MPTDLRLDQLQALTARHTACEFTHDIDALMQTVHPDPCWSYEPIGCDIATFAAVAEMYRRMFPTISSIKKTDVINVWFADDGFIAEVQVTRAIPDGGEATASQFTWCEFNGALISGECNYLDAGDVDLIVEALGKSFFTYPGVSVMTLGELAAR